MMNSADFRRLSTAGLTTEQIAIVMDMFDERDEKRKADQRARWHRHQENKRTANVSQREQVLANVPRGGDARVEDKTSNLEIEPQKEERNAQKREFASFWAEFPNKVGKLKAETSFVAARKRASFEAIMSGLARYVASKPADRAWLNPTTFLNQDRWEDQPGVVVPMARGSPSARPIDDLINHMSARMDEADASTTTEIEGHPAAPLRLSASQW